jgi:hypothetical protein
VHTPCTYEGGVSLLAGHLPSLVPPDNALDCKGAPDALVGPVPAGTEFEATPKNHNDTLHLTTRRTVTVGVDPQDTVGAQPTRQVGMHTLHGTHCMAHTVHGTHCTAHAPVVVHADVEHAHPVGEDLVQPLCLAGEVVHTNVALASGANPAKK